jgi:hypothetical protein
MQRVDMTNFQYATFVASPAGARAAGLLRTHRTPLLAMFEVVRLEVTDNLPGLIEGGLYSTEQLVGPEVWAAWPFYGQRRAGGMCLAFLVDIGAIPLELHKTLSGKGPKRYKLPRKK